MITIEEEDIVQWCQASDRELIGGIDTTTKVIRKNNLAIKFGAVYQEEADNQREAYNLLSNEFLRVPLVHRFFRKASVGYLVMEYIDGVGSGWEGDEDVSAVAMCFAYMHTFTSAHPGPIRQGTSRGLLWPEADPPSFGSSEELAAFVNSRLVVQNPEFSVSDDALCLCHLDLAPRNLLKAADASIVILDWSSAGYYPRSFEIAALRCNGRQRMDGIGWSARVEKSICAANPLTCGEQKQIDFMLEMTYNNVRYGFDRSREVFTVKRRCHKRKRIQLCEQHECEPHALSTMLFPGAIPASFSGTENVTSLHCGPAEVPAAPDTADDEMAHLKPQLSVKTGKLSYCAHSPVAHHTRGRCPGS
ncbi:hypothetical protein LTR56_025664 [Elasticomyces elasticus]|nr:hypothetical protein LTR56_025664 [Elasticomyces elasticus]KAK5738995.1 hypothetical protein LTS12_025411 [Elasticomyces elasticus]